MLLCDIVIAHYNSNMTEGQKLTLDVLKSSLSKVGKTFGEH